jgi:hypothetical protein
MKNFTNDNSKEFHNAGLESPMYGVGVAPEMPRASARGMNGDSKKLVVNAKYGVDGYEGSQKIVEMPRSTKASAGGSGASSLPPSSQYGVGGAGSGPKECYGVGGIAGAGGGNGPKRSSRRAAGAAPGG